MLCRIAWYPVANRKEGEMSLRALVREIVRSALALHARRHLGRVADSPKPFLLFLSSLAVAPEPVEGAFSVLADLDEVAVGIAHVAAPFPAVIF